MTTLALSDNAMVAMFAGQMVFNVIFALAFLWIKQRTRKIEDLEDAVKTYASQLIDSKIESKFDSLAVQAETIMTRLERGDDKFDRQDERDRKLELKFVSRVEELHRTILEEFATKKEHHHLAGKVETLQRQVDQKGAA